MAASVTSERPGKRDRLVAGARETIHRRPSAAQVHHPRSRFTGRDMAAELGDCQRGPSSSLTAPLAETRCRPAPGPQRHRTGQRIHASAEAR